METLEGGGYVTRGRAKELFDRMAELEREVDQRLGAMERRVDELVALEHESLRRRVQGDVELLRIYQATERGP